jgi:hypothetical protein
VVNIATVHPVQLRFDNDNESPRIVATSTTEHGSLGVPYPRHLVRAVHEVTEVDLRSVWVSVEAALHLRGDLVSEVRSEFKGDGVHPAVMWTRARRVDTPGPSSWSR